jgi:hypothetical protein
MVISHTGIKTNAADTAKVVAWYEKALAPLGYKKSLVIMDGFVNGFSDRPDGSHPDFWVSGAQEPGTPSTAHHAFAAKSRAEVEAFHKAGLEAGGKDNGPPGLRNYTPDYYAAFLFDPVGNNIEAVYFGPA